MIFFSSLSLCLFSPAGPGPVDTLSVAGLHSRSVSVSWVPPIQPNGIIRNYTLCLYPNSVTALDYTPSSVSSTSSTISSSLGPFPSLLPRVEDPDPSSAYNLRPTSSLATPQGLNHIAMSSVITGTNNGSGLFEDTLNRHFSTLKPHIVEDSHTSSTKIDNVSKDPRSVLFQSPEHSNSVGPNPSLSNLEYSESSYNTGHFAQDPIYRPTASNFSAVSRSTPLSVTVPGNTTTYTFLHLLPYQTYRLQVLHLL